MTMTGTERIQRILERKPIDRIGLYEHFWSDTQREWTKAGYMKEGENMSEHFGFDMDACWPFNFVADLDFGQEIIQETEETVLAKDGNGAVLRKHKLHDATPEHVDFTVKDRAGWEEFIKPRLSADPRRIAFDAYKEAKERARKAGRFFVWSGVNVFELMHPVCGHEYMLIGMALDPDWIIDMVDTYSRIIVELQQTLFEKEGYPDGIWFYEDLGFKGRAFISLDMYKEIIQPGHKRTIDYARSLELPVIMHSCGMVEKLVPGLIESGIDCLQVIEVKAGMDLLKLCRDYGHVLSFMGGIDVRALYSNDRDIISKELEEKIPEVMKRNGFVLHSDHSIPNTVHYDTYRYFINRGLELGTYK